MAEARWHVQSSCRRAEYLFDAHAHLFTVIHHITIGARGILRKKYHKSLNT